MALRQSQSARHSFVRARTFFRALKRHEFFWAHEKLVDLQNDETALQVVTMFLELLLWWILINEFLFDLDSFKQQTIGLCVRNLVTMYLMLLIWRMTLVCCWSISIIRWQARDRYRGKSLKLEEFTWMKRNHCQRWHNILSIHSIRHLFEEATFASYEKSHPEPYLFSKNFYFPIQNLRTLINSAKQGAILISWGGNINASSLSPETVREILKGLARLPQQFIWKWEDDTLARKLPKNVHIQRWLPQRDILGKTYKV